MGEFRRFPFSVEICLAWDSGDLTSLNPMPPRLYPLITFAIVCSPIYPRQVILTPLFCTFWIRPPFLAQPLIPDLEMKFLFLKMACLRKIGWEGLISS